MVRRWGDRTLVRLRYLRYSRTPRRILLAVFGVLVLGFLWIVFTGFLARQEAVELGSRIQRVRTLIADGRIDEAEMVGRDLPAIARRTHALTTGPAWWVASSVPFLGNPVAATRSITTQADRLGGNVAPKLLAVAQQLDPSSLRTSGASIRLDLLTAAGPRIDAAARALDRTSDSLARVPSSWLTPVDTRRRQLAKEVSTIQGYVRGASRVARILPPMLGGRTPQRFFVGFQNEAEMRGTGGLPGAFAIAVADQGRLRFTHFESDSVLLPAASAQLIHTGLDFGADYRTAYAASDPTSSYVDSNVSPDFSYAARIWAAMWQKVSGEHVDSVVAVDPEALKYLLEVLGPVNLTGGAQLNADNVVPVLERDQYVYFPKNSERKQFLVSVLRATAGRLVRGQGSTVDLVRVGSLASRNKRLLVYSRDPNVQHLLVQAGYAGTIPDTRHAFGAVILNNAAAGKLDYYLTRSLNYSRTGCGARRRVVVTITLRNSAPATGLPPYVNTRLDKAPASAKPGDNRTLMDYFATQGASLVSVTLNGRPSTATALTVSGHPVYRMDLELPRAQTQTIQLVLNELANTGTPVLWSQPGVHPLHIARYDQSCI